MSLLTNINSYWKLDESSGNASDSTGNGYTLTNNGTTAFVPVLIRNGLDFGTSNTTKYLRNATALGLNGSSSFTVNFWVKLRTEQADGTLSVFSDLFAGTGSSQQRVEIFYIGGSGTATLVFRRGNGTTDTDITRTGQLGTSNINMLTIKGDGTNLEAYFNSVSIGTATYTAPATYGISEKYTVGASSDDIPTGFSTCEIDEIGVWSRTLSYIEIVQLFNFGTGIQYPFNSSGNFLDIL